VPKPPTNPVTPEAREAFAMYLQHWQDKLGLQDWRIALSDKPSRFAAEVSKQDMSSRLAVIRLGRNFGSEPVNDETLENTAVHELCHVLLHELIETAIERRYADDAVRAAEHRVIHTIINLLVHGR
jgi:hypothetical protein